MEAVSVVDTAGGRLVEEEVEAEAVVGVLVLDAESAVGELLELLSVLRRGVNMEKNFLTLC